MEQLRTAHFGVSVDRPDRGEVLVVDDSLDQAQAVGMMLARKGYTVRTATEGAAALALIAEAVPCYVILDVRMPNMGGYEFARHLRAQYQHDIVLIAISGLDATSPEVLEICSVVDRYLRKPLDYSQLDKIFPAPPQL